MTPFHLDGGKETWILEHVVGYEVLDDWEARMAYPDWRDVGSLSIIVHFVGGRTRQIGVRNWGECQLYSMELWQWLYFLLYFNDVPAMKRIKEIFGIYTKEEREEIERRDRESDAWKEHVELKQRRWAMNFLLPEDL